MTNDVLLSPTCLNPVIEAITATHGWRLIMLFPTVRLQTTNPLFGPFSVSGATFLKVFFLMLLKIAHLSLG